MKRTKLLIALAGCVLVAAYAEAQCCGCGKKAAAEKAAEDKGEAGTCKAHAKCPALCGSCGQIKGSEACCDKAAEKCGECGLAKGSPGCCKLPVAGEDAKLCVKCGQIKGSDVCCDEAAEKCGKCGLAKGSPGCCKLAGQCKKGAAARGQCSKKAGKCGGGEKEETPEEDTP